MGREPARLGSSSIRRRGLRPHERLLENFPHPELRPHRIVGELPIAAQQVVEICRALASRRRILLMDEPTSSLQRADVERSVRAHPAAAHPGIGHRLHQPLPGGDARDRRRLHRAARRAERRRPAESPIRPTSSSLRTWSGARSTSSFPNGTRHDAGEVVLAVRDLRAAPPVRQQASFDAATRRIARASPV